MPFPNFHAARVKDPDLFDHIVVLKTLPNGIMIYGGPLKSNPKGPTETQTYRFPKEKFTVQEAKTWLKEHDIKPMSFEPATEENKLIFNKSNESVDIYLYGTIGSHQDDNEIDGDYIAAQIRAFDESGVKIINEHINSDGGEITNGLSIVAANLNCQNAKVYTYNDGVAASMAGIIHQTGAKKFAAPYAQFMMHEPSMLGDTIETTTDPLIKKRLQSAKDQLISILGASTGLSNEKLENMMRQETWLNAQECEKFGFVSPGCVMSYPRVSINQNLVPKDILVIVNKAFNNLNDNQMAKTTCAKCGEKFEWEEGKDAMSCPGCKAKLNAKGEVIEEPKKKAEGEPATDKITPVVDKVAFDKLSDQVTSLTNLVNGLKTENAVLKAESEAAKKKQTELILDKAIEEGKIVSTAKDQFLIDYATNPDGLRKIVDSIPMGHNSILGVIDKTKQDAPLPGGFKTLRELEKANPALAEKFAMENPVAYDKFYSTEYKS